MQDMVIYRKPWFWGLIAAVVAVFAFVVFVAASNTPGREARTTTVVQQPPPAPDTTVPQPIPVPSATSQPPANSAPITTPAPAPEPPVQPQQPVRTIIKEKPQIIREKVIVREPAKPANPDDTAAAANAPAHAGTGAPEMFQNTGLPRTVRFESSSYRATGITHIEDPSTLTSIGTTEDGTELFVSQNATPPYLSVVVPVPDQEGAYLTYQKR